MIGPRNHPLTLRIRRHALDAIREHARAAAPDEACGALEAAPDGVIARAAPATNEAGRSRHRYLIGPDCVRTLEAEARLRSLRVVGFYHSHPAGPGHPSALDVETAWPWYVYLIAGTDGVRAWRLREDRLGFREVQLREVSAAAGPVEAHA